MIKFKDNVMVSDLDDEKVLMDIENGYYFSLNESATEIVELLMNGTDTNKTASIISSKYNVDIETIKTDINELIEQLKIKNLI